MTQIPVIRTHQRIIYHAPNTMDRWTLRSGHLDVRFPTHGRSCQLIWVCMWYAMVYQHNDRWGGKWIKIYKDEINDIMRNGYEMLWIQSISPWYFLNDETFCKTIRYSDPSRRAAFHPWVTAGTTPRIWVETWAWALRLEPREWDIGGVWHLDISWPLNNKIPWGNEGYNMI